MAGYLNARKNINPVFTEFRQQPETPWQLQVGQCVCELWKRKVGSATNSKEKMSYKDFRESGLRFSDSLNGQRWIFLKKGLDDFRDGFPPSSDNMIVYGRKRPVSITLQNGTLKSSSTVRWKKRKKYSQMQVCLSKLSLLQQARRDYVAQIECCLKRNPVVLYPGLEKSTSPKLLRGDAGVLDPEVLWKSKAGYGVCQQENQPLQEMLDHMEDKQSKVTVSKTRVHGEEFGGKTLCTWLSKKKVAGGEKEAVLTDWGPPDENIKRAIKHYCDWVMSLEMEVTQLHSTQAFKEFLERKGYRKPRFLPEMLAGGNDSRAPEKTSKACKNISKEISKKQEKAC